MTKLYNDVECACCGETIKKGEYAQGVKDWYSGKWHISYECKNCDKARLEEIERERMSYQMD